MAAPSANTVRGALLALTLGLAPLAAGCFSARVDTSMVAWHGVAHDGEPIPVRVVVGQVVDRTGEAPPALPDVVARSLAIVLRRTGLVAAVRDAEAPPGPEARDFPEVRLESEILAWDLYQSYAWWGLYLPIFAIPVIGTGGVVAVILLAGGPFLSNVGLFELRVRAIDLRTGRAIATYRAKFEEVQPASIYESGKQAKSFIYYPERVLQDVCGQIVHQMVEDRWTYRRLGRE